MTALIACGLAREARIVAGAGVVAIAGGGDGERLEAELERHAGAARLILSSGLCGALDPTLKVGDLVIGGLAAAEPSSADDRLLSALRSLLPDARFGAFAGGDRIVATSADKAALRLMTGAIAADMESHVAERVARRHALPFAILRVVSDEAGQSLPPAALVGMRPDGGVDLARVMRSLATRPAQLPALITTGLNAERAFRALLRGFHRLRAAGTGDLDAHFLDVV